MTQQRRRCFLLPFKSFFPFEHGEWNAFEVVFLSPSDELGPRWRFQRSPGAGSSMKGQQRARDRASAATSPRRRPSQRWRHLSPVACFSTSYLFSLIHQTHLPPSLSSSLSSPLSPPPPPRLNNSRHRLRPPRRRRGRRPLPRSSRRPRRRPRLPRRPRRPRRPRLPPPPTPLSSSPTSAASSGPRATPRRATSACCRRCARRPTTSSG